MKLLVVSKAWREDFTASYNDFCERADGGEDTLIDPYACESNSEFFAVMSEAFFELPAMDEYAAFYDQLDAFYRQDPAARSK